MEYTQDVLERSSGELVSRSLGDWITITEVGEQFGVGPRQTRSILREMEFVVVEGQERNSRHRLARWVTDAGWGKRLSPKGRYPFDVIGPKAQAWVASRWAGAAEKSTEVSETGRVAKTNLRAFLAARPDLEASSQGQVARLCDFYPSLSQSEKGRIVGISQQLVGRFEKGRMGRLRKLIASRRQFATSDARPITGPMIVSRHITEAYNPHDQARPTDETPAGDPGDCPK